MAKNSVNMLSGSVFKGLLTIAMPIMLMNVLQSLYNIIDMSILKLNDANGLSAGAVGVSSTLISLITGLLIGISSGTSVVVARFIGKGDYERVEKSIGTAILFAMIGGAVLLVIGVSFAELFMKMLNCSEVLLSSAALYFRLYFLGVPLLLVYNFTAGILRASGDTKRPMYFAITGGALKVILTFVFVAFFNLGVLGVGIATIISWVLMCFLGVRALLKNSGVVKLKLNRIRFYASELKEILFIGIPTGAQQALYSVANVIIVSTVNTFGEYATSGVAIANTFDGLMYQIVMAPTYAVMPFVSQNVGNRNMKRALEAVWKGMLITLSFGVVLGSLSAIFSNELCSLMSDNPEVLEYARQKMVIVSSTYFLTAINEILGVSLKGMKRPIVPMVCTMIFMCAIRFPWVYLVFPHFTSLTYLYLIWPIGWVSSAIVLCFFFFPTVRKLKKQFKMELEQQKLESKTINQN
ncbi:MAG: MATE family efflux transporter [Clostridia bacterium]|nr:MATE family efflux transporter [Clostridia bacterium]